MRMDKREASRFFAKVNTLEGFMDLLEHRLALQGSHDVVLLFYRKVKA